MALLLVADPAQYCLESRMSEAAWVSLGLICPTGFHRRRDLTQEKIMRRFKGAMKTCTRLFAKNDLC